MPAEQPQTEVCGAGECRRCQTFCDKLIEPRGCIEMRCRFLYSYVDFLTGVHYMGCMQKVYGAELDLESVLVPGGFGGIKMTGQPLPQCQFKVDPCYEGEGDAYACVNPRFFDCTDAGPEGIRAFDLRNAL